MEAKILVVDDEPALGEMVKDMLEDPQLIIEVVSDPDSALQTHKKFQPTLALVDYQLGTLTGLELAGQFKKEDPDLPIILMTAYPSLDLAMRAIQQEIYDFIVKPINSSFLMRSVHKAIEHRKLVEENKQLLENLKRTNAMKSKFLSIVTHDLRTPITSVQGYCAMLLDQKNLTPVQKETFLSYIQKSILRMNQMVGTLMDLVSIEAGKLKIEKRPLDYSAICKELEGMFTPLAKDKGVELSWVGLQAHLTLEGDPLRLHQVISNLISNALKHTPKGGKIEVNVSVSDRKILTQVTDSGEGILKADQEKIFEEFYQGETHRLEGLGLGLSIAKEIVSAHGGHISCKSLGAGQGSTFYFTLPISG